MSPRSILCLCEVISSPLLSPPLLSSFLLTSPLFPSPHLSSSPLLSPPFLSSPRDVKPHNVLISPPDSSKPWGVGVLTDFGSVTVARLSVDTRQQGLQAEEEAALKSSAAYRAPELTSVRPPVQICEKVDVWSMGCTMFSLAFGRSPFEVNNAVQRLGILNARYQFPQNNSMRECRYSDQYVQLINDMLELDPSMRCSPSHLHYIYLYHITHLFPNCTACLPSVLLFLISLILYHFLPSLLLHYLVSVYPLYSTQPLTLHQSPSPFRLIYRVTDLPTPLTIFVCRPTADAVAKRCDQLLS